MIITIIMHVSLVSIRTMQIRVQEQWQKMVISTRTMQMKLLSTRTMPNEVAKHKNNASEGAKLKNNGRR